MRRRDLEPSSENVSARLPTSITTKIMRMMDLRSLAIWRATCQQHLFDSMCDINHTINDTLRRFFRSPTIARTLLQEADAVICGEAALCIIARGLITPADVLDVIVPDECYDMLISRMIEVDGVQEDIERVSNMETNEAVRAERHITDVTRLNLDGGRQVYIHCTNMVSAVSPLTKMPCTALMNFVSWKVIGCAYPDLTFAQKNLLCDRVTPEAVLLHEKLAMRRIEDRGFESVCPRQYCADRKRAHLANTPPEVFAGKEEAYLCPLTARFFGDKYSMLLSIEAEEIHEGYIPYGAMPIFRLPTSTQCDGEHRLNPQVLPRHVLALEAVIVGETKRLFTPKYTPWDQWPMLTRSRSWP